MGPYLNIGFVAKATTELPAGISKGKLLEAIEGKRVRLYITIVALGSEGKFLMEECRKTLHFMETCAQRAVHLGDDGTISLSGQSVVHSYKSHPKITKT